MSRSRTRHITTCPKMTQLKGKNMNKRDKEDLYRFLESALKWYGMSGCKNSGNTESFTERHVNWTQILRLKHRAFNQTISSASDLVNMSL